MDVFEIYQMGVAAASNGHINCLRLLIKNGLDITWENNALLCNLCIYNVHRDIYNTVKFLLENGADAAGQGNTIAFEANIAGHDKVVELLVAHGAILGTEASPFE